MTATTHPAWLAGLVARHGEPLIVRQVYDMSTEHEYTWPGFTVRVGESWGVWFVVATRHGGRVVNLGGLVQPPTDADISGVVALAGLDDAPAPRLLPHAFAAGYAEAVARLRDDARYTNWWMSGDCSPDGPIRQHLGDYLEAVGPDGVDVTAGDAKPEPAS